MLKIPIKAGQITNLTDARYFAAREVNWLGFSLDTSADTLLPPQQIHAIKEWIEGPKIIIEFGLQSPEEISSAIEYLQPDAIQLSMFADPAAIKEVVSLPIFKEVVIESPDLGGLKDLLSSQSTVVDCFIIDFAKNDILYTDLSIDQRTLLKDLCSDYKLLFHWSDQPASIQQFIEQIQPHGLAMVGGEEEKVGFKSFDELDDLLDLLEIEE